MSDPHLAVLPDFYNRSVNSPNPFTRYYHQTRYRFVRTEVRRYYRPGAVILDVGCATSDWNEERLPLTGIDISPSMLKEALARGTISKSILGDIGAPLPLETGSVDIVVISEVLEHTRDPQFILSQIFRVLKSGGHLILTVPHDEPPSLWSVLFPLQCIYMGRIKGDPYYKANCGHIQHFGPSSLSAAVVRAGLRPARLDKWLGLNLAMVAEKP